MSDEELSLKIAEFLEPKPTNEPWTFPCQSPKRGWRTPIPAICDGKTPWNYWVAQSFVTDPSMTMFLLEKLLYCNDLLFLKPDRLSSHYECRIGDYE